jgi:CheY-like chemotaxis protein
MWRLLTAEDALGSAAAESQHLDDTTAIHAQCRVLVVDDDAAIRQAVAALLEDDGYVVDQAANGLEALARLDQHLPKVVLLDMRMPLMDGWSVAGEIRERNLDVNVVAMTATHNARLWADQIGAPNYLGKPFEPDELLQLVDRLCRS